jgi:hypothetical protein
VDEFGEEVLRVETDGFVGGVVEFEVFESESAGVVSGQGAEEGEGMLCGCGMGLVGQYGRVEVLLWELEALKVVLKLGFAVPGTIVFVQR